MLTDLQITNFAIIENQTLSFHNGLNVITGETGSGKSIVLEALGLILGDRANTSLIRNGAETLEVHANFHLDNIDEDIFDSLPDIAKNNKEELSISRILSSSGRGKVFINGGLTTVGVLQETASKLINICGQNQQIRLLDSRFHLELLDAYAENSEQLKKYRESYGTWKKEYEVFESLKTASLDGKRRREELEDWLKELDEVDLQSGLREDLESKVKKLSSVNKSEGLLKTVSELLEGDESIIEKFRQVVSINSEISKVDTSYKNIFTTSTEIYTSIKELASDTERYANTLTGDDTLLELAETRLSKLARIERKYRATGEELIQLYKQYQKEYEVLSTPASLQAIEKRCNELLKNTLTIAEVLSKKRKTAEITLSKTVAQELADLNMQGVLFKFSFNAALDTPNLNGIDSGQFLIATNPGEPLQPLKEIASGGELSRILLVLKKVLREKSGVNVLVFDEVDTGISGSVARSVGEKLKSLAKESQVLCVTHLAQVASLGDHHMLVEKQFDKGRAVTRVRELSMQERIDEIARMLSGKEISKTARKTAEELIGI